MEMQKLKSGETAVQIDHMIYAAVPVQEPNREIAVFTRYTPNRQPPESLLLAEKFTRDRFSDDVTDMNGFEALMLDLKKDSDQKAALARKSYSASTSTPWGKADYAKQYTRGIIFYGTPSHGGFKVSNGMNAKMPDALRNDDGWYEEDCEWAKVAFSFPQFFTDRELADAKSTLINWLPDEYEAFTGEVIAPGQSHVKDEKAFKKEHENDWIVISAVSSKEHEGFVECIATLGGRRQRHDDTSSPEEKKYLVPSAEYRSRSGYGFVISLDRHEEVDLLPALGMR